MTTAAHELEQHLLGRKTVEKSSLESAILAYLSGTDPDTAAQTAGVSIDHLTRAADRYRAAGLATLAPTAGWAQINVEFTNYADAEDAFRKGLWPTLQSQSWWFVRKTPCWRLRFPSTHGMPDGLRAALEEMAEGGVLRRWDEAIYEPETAAFGGTDGIEAVHGLHRADAAGLFAYLDAAAAPTYDGPGRSVASLMVLSHLMRAAGLEWTEQGDVWARVESHRPPAPITADQAAALATNAREPLAADLTVLIENDPRFVGLSTWATGMQTAGSRLMELHRGGGLQTGLREVLARAVIFCWNRAGFTTEQQAVWAQAARLAIMG